MLVGASSFGILSDLGISCFVIYPVAFAFFIELINRFAFVSVADFVSHLLDKMLVGAETLLFPAQFFDDLFFGADILFEVGSGFLIAAEPVDFREKGKDNADERKSDCGQRGGSVNSVPVILRTHGAEYRGMKDE